jgi:hypothetical protein
VVAVNASSAQPRARPAPPGQHGSPQVNAAPVQRDSTAETFAGFLAATAIFVGAIALAVRPLPLSLAAIVLSFVATAMSGPRSARISALAVGVAATSFVLGMTIAVLTDRPLY